MTPSYPWWRRAAIYQVYLRSFADGNGDGIGDLAGIRARLPYLRRPRRRRDLVQPVVPVADGRRRLRRGRLPRHRPGVRHARRGRGADRRGARARPPDHHRHRAEPLLRPAPLVPGRAGGGPGLARAGPVLVPGRPGRDGDLPPNDWQSIFGGPAWTRVAGRRSGTCTCSRPSSPTSTGTTPRSARSSRTSCGSGSTAASTASGSTRPRCWSKDPALPDFDPATPPDPHPYNDRDEVHDDLPGLARDRRRLRPAAGAHRRGLAARPAAVRPLPAPGRAAHGVQLRLPRLPVGRRRAARRRSTSTLAAHAPSARRATWVLSNHDVTRHVTRYGRADTVVRATTGAQPGTAPGRPGARHPPGPRRRAAAPWRCPARSTSTRARSSACPRSRTSRTSCARTRSGTAPAAPTPAGTAAGCRCPGPVIDPPFGFCPRRPAGALAAAAGPVARI